MSTWNMEKTLNLIEDFRNNPCLWDTTSPLYKYKNKKMEVYHELAHKYSVHHSQMEKKIQSLKSQFRRERKRIKSVEKSAKPKCNWFGYTPLLFLHNHIVDDGNEETDNDTVGAEIKAEVIENSVEQDESVTNSEIDYSYSMNSQSQTATEKSILKTEPSELGNGTLQCMKTLIDVVAKRDEFSVYGDYVADKLRNCGRSKIEIHIAQHHIDNVAFNLIMGVYGRGATGGAGILSTVSGVPNLALKDEKN